LSKLHHYPAAILMQLNEWLAKPLYHQRKDYV
jgi:hypothetical protein